MDKVAGYATRRALVRHPRRVAKRRGPSARGEGVGSARETLRFEETETNDAKSGLGPKERKRGKRGRGREGERERERDGEGRRLSLWHALHVQCARVRMRARGVSRGWHTTTTTTSTMCTTTTTPRGGCTKTPWWGSGCRPYSPPLEMISVATRSREPQHVVTSCTVPLS